MNEKIVLSIVLSDQGAAVKLAGDCDGMLAAWTILTHTLSEEVGITISNLAIQLPGADKAIMEDVRRGTQINIDVSEIRRQQEGQDGTDA